MLWSYTIYQAPGHPSGGVRQTSQHIPALRGLRSWRINPPAIGVDPHGTWKHMETCRCMIDISQQFCPEIATKFLLANAGFKFDHWPANNRHLTSPSEHILRNMIPNWWLKNLLPYGPIHNGVSEWSQSVLFRRIVVSLIPLADPGKSPELRLGTSQLEVIWFWMITEITRAQ